LLGRLGKGLKKTSHGMASNMAPGGNFLGDAFFAFPLHIHSENDSQVSF
jgi:hypothetical protein